MLADFESRINVNDEYQRAVVWSRAQQALLIDSILRGFDIPKLFLRKLPDGSPSLFSVIDGKQRLTSIWKFMNDDLSLLKSADPFPGFGNLGGKQWSDLPDNAKDRLQFTHLTVSKIEDATDDEIRELFLRLQRGAALKAAEKRNAIAGPVRDFVARQLAVHRVWALTGISAARFGRDEHAAIILTLVLNRGPAPLKGADLLELYGDQHFDPDGMDAHRTISLMDMLADVAAFDTSAIQTRWGIVDLSISLMRLENDEHQVRPEMVMRFFRQFESERRSVGAALNDLQTTLVEDLHVSSTGENGFRDDDGDFFPGIPPDMLTYHLAFAREGASRQNVNTRSQIMYDRLLAFLSNNGGNDR